MKNIFAMLLLGAYSASAAAPLTLRYTSKAESTSPYQTTIWQGETVDLQCTLTSYGSPLTLAPDAAASLWYQTNGMASAWWQGPATATTSGVLTAHWSPSLDVGATAYTYFIGVGDSATNTLYRSYGIIRIGKSPGYVPNALPLPRQSIDFATLDILNAPWATPEVATNALAIAEAALTAEVDTLATVTARGSMTTNAVTIGVSGVGAIGESSFRQGLTVDAIGKYSHAEGLFTTASGNYSHAEGVYTTASGNYSHAEGLDATASGSSSHAEGDSTKASGLASHAEGESTTASGIGSHAEGAYTTASKDYSHASGFKSVSSNDTAFVFQGSAGGYDETPYGSHGNGTFNINPVGGLAGFWIGDATLEDRFSEKLDKAFPDIATNLSYNVIVSNGHWLIKEVQ